MSPALDMQRERLDVYLDMKSEAQTKPDDKVAQCRQRAV
jgi:hypothetical protein